MSSNFEQMRLDLASPVSFDMADFIVSVSNADAVTFIHNWQTWPSHFAALSGPKACGKTHLLHAWAQEVGAEFIDHGVEVAKLRPTGFYAFDDVNKRDDDGEFLIKDVDLFHLYNWAREIDATILVTSKKPPTQWQRTLPDLISRLGVVPVASIDEADNELLIQLLIKLFSDKQLPVEIDVIHYIVQHMERSFSSAYTLVDFIDKSALGTRRKISKKLVGECLQTLQETT